MDIRNTKELKQFAGSRLETARNTGTITLIFAAVVIGLSVLTAAVDYLLELQIDQSGGLSNLGTRSLLSTLQTMLPLVQTVVAMCMELGYMAAMLRVARGQYTSPNTLRLGFDRFWKLLRYRILESLIYISLGTASLYLAAVIYVLTPLSKPVTALLEPLMAQSSLLSPDIVISDALANQMMDAMLPAFILFGVIYLIAAVPVMYRLRMVSYVIIDKPGLGVMAAFRESRKMMKGNCISLLRLDLSLWWFMLAQFAAMAVCYGDVILPMLGVSFPFSDTVAFFLFYGLYWALEFVIFYFLRSRVEVVYALAYDAICPREEQNQGAVLGSIFQM